MSSLRSKAVLEILPQGAQDPHPIIPCPWFLDFGYQGLHPPVLSCGPSWTSTPQRDLLGAQLLQDKYTGQTATLPT